MFPNSPSPAWGRGRNPLADAIERRRGGWSSCVACGDARSSKVRPRSEARQAACGDLQRVEALLFAATEPLSFRRIAQLAGLADSAEAKALVRRLNEGYDDSAAAFRLEQVAGGWQLRTRREFAPWLRRFARGDEARPALSQPMLETLAVAAYRQPLGRAEIESIRGVRCGEVLRQLLETDYLRIAGRSEELGRPYLYATTQRFLEVFGLRGLRDLPEVSDLNDDRGDSGVSASETTISTPESSSACKPESDN